MLDKRTIENNHIVCLELLDKFIDVCERNQIDYYLAFGSCLGTIRHKGFIPWDINIDVFLNYEEFKKLDDAMHKENLVNMQWCCPEGKARMFPFLIRDDSLNDVTTPNIDMSVYTNAPNNKIVRFFIIKMAYLNIRMYKLKNTAIKRTFPFNILKLIASVFPDSFYTGFVELISKINKNKKSKYQMVLLPSEWKDVESIKTEWYGEEPFYGIFEGRKVRIVKEYDAYLRHVYGDYMKPTVWEGKGEYKHVAQ